MTASMTASKTNTGNFFEDFRVGQVFQHATPRTMTVGDIALYSGLYGARFAVQSSEPFAQAIGYPRAPIDDLMVFHVVFGKSVPDISRNAIANLGYADCRFLTPVYPGDTLTAMSEVVGVKENSNRTSGVVYVRTTGRKQSGEIVLEFVRWVMLRKRNAAAAAPEPVVPKLAERVDPAVLAGAVPAIDVGRYAFALAGEAYRWADYTPGERLDHAEAMTLEEAEHQIATRLYQNTARVHFNQHEQAQGQFKRRLVYGGIIMSLARALSHNGLANAFHIAAINGGRHVAPAFAGDTIYAWSEILEVSEIPRRRDVGALRARLVAVKNRSGADFSLKTAAGTYSEGVLLDLDLWLILPR
jgi:2-methylfumaryl-CoA hydratase